MVLLDFFRIKQSFFFFNDTATTEIYTLSLHDALPILEETAADSVFVSLRYLSRLSYSSFTDINASSF